MNLTSKFAVEADGEVLDGTLVEPSSQAGGRTGGAADGEGPVRPAVVIMHGAGTASQERNLPLAADFADRGLRAVVFDFSGHGHSTGRLLELSLRRRRDQARAVIDRILPARSPLLLVGFSMSGQTVADLVGVYGERVAGIGLVAPAMYDAAAWDVTFGPTFSELIRRPESWRDTRAVAAYAGFRGRAVLVLPERDDVIPPGVTALLADTLRGRPDAEFQQVCLPGSPHQLGLWLSEHPQDRATVVDVLLSGTVCERIGIPAHV